MLVCQMLVDKPFMAVYGQVTKSWEDFTYVVNKLSDENGLLIFDPPVKWVTLKDQFENKCMPFVKSFQAKQPFLSGCDDQPPPPRSNKASRVSTERRATQ